MSDEYSTIATTRDDLFAMVRDVVCDKYVTVPMRDDLFAIVRDVICDKYPLLAIMRDVCTIATLVEAQLRDQGAGAGNPTPALPKFTREVSFIDHLLYVDGATVPSVCNLPTSLFHMRQVLAIRLAVKKEWLCVEQLQVQPHAKPAVRVSMSPEAPVCKRGHLRALRRLAEQVPFRKVDSGHMLQFGHRATRPHLSQDILVSTTKHEGVVKQILALVKSICPDFTFNAFSLLKWSNDKLHVDEAIDDAQPNVVFVIGGSADLWLQLPGGTDQLSVIEDTEQDAKVKVVRGACVPQRALPWVLNAASVPHTPLIPRQAWMLACYTTARGMSETARDELAKVGFPLPPIPNAQHFDEAEM
eukprot:819748-Amphidinium_carterae.1